MTTTSSINATFACFGSVGNIRKSIHIIPTSQIEKGKKHKMWKEDDVLTK